MAPSRPKPKGLPWDPVGHRMSWEMSGSQKDARLVERLKRGEEPEIITAEDVERAHRALKDEK